MVQKGERELGLTADPGHPGAPRPPGLPDQIGGAQVGEFLALEVPPDGLAGVELWRVAWQPLKGEPGPLREQVGAQRPAPMGGEAIPNLEDGRAAAGVVSARTTGRRLGPG